MRVRRERVLAPIATPEWPDDSLRASNATTRCCLTNATSATPCTRNIPPGQLLFGTGAAQSLAPGHGRERLLHHHKATRHRWESAERSRNVQTDVLLPATFPSIERSACRYITAPLVAAFTKQGAFCLFHESPLAKRHAPARPASKYPLHPLLKKCPSLAPPVWIHFSCFMGEVAHCRFTRQHASGQLTAGRYPPVSVDVALAAALNRQRWA